MSFRSVAGVTSLLQEGAAHSPQPRLRKHQLKAGKVSSLVIEHPSPSPQVAMKVSPGPPTNNTHFPSLVLGTQAHCESCGFSLVRHCGHPGRPGMGLDLPRAAGRGPWGTEALFQSSHTSLRDLTKGSHVLLIQPHCYSHTFPTIKISWRTCCSSSLHCPSLCLSACKTPPHPSMLRSNIICVRHFLNAA